MVMDFLRAGYDVPMRTYQGQASAPSVRWRRANADALWWTAPTPFRSRTWIDPDERENEGLGEGWPYDPCDWPRPRQNPPNVRYLGLIVCPSGTRAFRVFREGGEAGRDAPVQVGPDGYAPCCTIAQPWVGDGGQGVGGGADFGAGMAWTAAGGLVKGGTTPQTAGYAWTAGGGLEKGGAASLGAGDAWGATGGLSKGGAAEQGGGLWWAAAGGLTKGGSAAQYSGDTWGALGGLKAGGAAAVAVGYAWAGAGGQVMGGDADQGGTGLASPARVTQVLAEVLLVVAPDARVTQTVAEILETFSPPVRVTQAVVEVLRQG